jgi:hypothetical protein
MIRTLVTVAGCLVLLAVFLVLVALLFPRFGTAP